MLIYYNDSFGRQNVPASSPWQFSLQETLNIFHGLDKKRGFIGIMLDDPFVLQLLPKRNGFRIEILNTAIPAIDSIDVLDLEIPERLIVAAGKGEDVVKVAHEVISGWKHMKLK